MKRIYFNIVVLLAIAFAFNACTNKKVENNIKSLEKRVAALEGKSGIAAPAAETPSASAASTGSDTDIPVMSFDTTEYDFGSVNEGDVVDYTFKFKNTGNFPLIINKATATCGCTVPEWPKDPIAVGGSGEIRVKFNSKNRSNLQTKYVNINANTKPEVTRLKITGMVVASNNNG